MAKAFVLERLLSRSGSWSTVGLSPDLLQEICYSFCQDPQEPTFQERVKKALLEGLLTAYPNRILGSSEHEEAVEKKHTWGRKPERKFHQKMIGNTQIFNIDP